MIDFASNVLDELAEDVDYSIVGPRDSRVHEVDTTRFPFNTVCHVERDFGDGRWRGCSGTLIGPRTVLTAGHCLYNHMLRRAPARVRIIPGRRDRDTKPFGAIPAARCYVARGYIVRGRGSIAARVAARRDADYGVVVLERPIAGIRRFMTVQAPTEADIARIRSRKLLTIAGYPGDRPIGTMWRHAERLAEVTPRRLFYTVDTCPGHSGSAIWYRRLGGDERVIIGVHTSGVVDEQGRSFGCSPGTVMAPGGMRNSGVRLTTEIVANIRNPARIVGGLPAMARVR